LYKTGDKARYLPDGNIEFLGRIDNQVKIRGFRIELGEIEAVLSQHPSVHSVVVIVRVDTPGDQRLVAYIVPQNHYAPTISELRQFLKTKLPEYMVPNAIVILEALPLTPNGKVDHRALPSPELDRELLDKFFAPRNPIEEMLALIWADVLKVEQVGIHDNFFELGGHSLLATQLISRIRTSLKVELPLRSLFAAATVAQLAQEIQQWQQQQLELAAPPLLPTPRNAHLSLSFAQQRLWFLDQFKPNSAIYNIPGAFRLQGQLQVTALEQSLGEIIARHEVLRTNFITVDGQPVQIIHTETTWSLSILDWQHLPKSEQEIATQQLAIVQSQRPFDLANEPLFRATLVVLSETEHILLVCMHHIVSDGWSIGVFVQELAALYNAFCQGQPSLRDATQTPLAPLPIQYADFALWQRQWLQGDVLQSQLAYWQQQLANAPAFLSLPTDRPRPAVQTFSGAHQEFTFSVELTRALTQLSQQQGVTLFMTLLAAFDTLLYRYSGTEDILVGSPIANRNRSELEGLIGFFVNTLVLRTDLSGNPSFDELLARVRHMTIDAYAHQDLPFEMLVEALQPQRDLSHTPLFQVMLVLQNAPMTQVELNRLTVSSLPTQSTTAKFDLTLSMENTADGLVGVWEYNTGLFDSSTIERMTGHFQTLLEGIVANPQQRISQLPLLTEVEQQQLLLECNSTSVEYPQDKCIYQLFESQVQRSPNAVALVYENQQLTYHELNCRANQLAHHLRSVGVGPEVLVGLCVERSLEMVVGLLGILKAGGAYVPIDPLLPQERLAFILEDAQISLLLTQQQLLQNLPKKDIPVLCIDSDWEVIAQQTAENPICLATAQDLAYIIYTSGSTGQPKGVLINHSNVVRLFAATQEWFDFNQKDVWTLFHSFAFDFSVWEIWGALIYGGRLVVVPYWVSRSATAFYDLLCKEQVTVLNQTPSAFQQLSRAEETMTAPTDLAVRWVIFGGEALEIQSLKAWLARHGVESPRLVNMYGITETTVHVTYCPITTVDVRQGAGSAIGCPIPDLQVYVLDRQQQLLPIGVPGELHIGGAGLARGYLNRPQLTQEKFIPNPFSTDRHSRLYKTGDKARYLPDGNIEFLGRIDNQVKIRGFRIELGEIEAVLSQHPSVHSVVVIVRVDTPGDQRLVAYIVPQNHYAPTISELRQFLKTKLPEYMVPNAIVILEALPLTPNGKVDHRALPSPELDRELLDKFFAPRNPIEEMLALIWADVLKVEQVGIHDNFFELGGHSLLATQLISRIRTSLKVELPLRSLFAAATVAQLAQEIQQWQQQQLELAAPPLLPTPRNAHLSLSFAQQRLWFLDQFKPNSAIYNIPGAFRLVGNLNRAALEQSLIEIIHRHEALRTNFVTINGKPSQIIQKEITWTVSIFEWQHLPRGEQEIATQQLAKQQAIQPFDLAKGALIRATLVVLNETEHILLVCMHHIVSDGWSMGVFISELATLYNAYSHGQPSPLAPLPIQYADFALWQRNWLKGSVLQTQLSYWQQQLKDAPALLSLPTDRPRPAIQTFAGAHQDFAITGELTRKLAKLSQEQGVTLFMTLLAAYNTLLYRYTGQTDILVGSPIANRDRSEIEGLIGFFLNTLVLRTNLAGNPSFSELLSQVREVALGAYAHQNLPFEMLVEVLQPERNLSYSPLFQVMFVLQNTPMSEVEIAGLTISSLSAQNTIAKFDLTLSMHNSPTGLVGAWEYNTDLFDASTIERMTGHFVTLLEGIVANPKEQILQLPLLTQPEQQQLLVGWNDTGVDYPLDKCIHQLFEEQVERTPDAVAVVYENEQLTYHQLNCRANQLAHYLRSLGVKPDTLVGICVKRSLEMVVGLLGILKAGGAYVPLDPDYPTDRLRFVLEDAALPVLLTQQSLLEFLPEFTAQVVCLDSDRQLITQHSLENSLSGSQPENLAYVIYTSGSTGQPKGVEVSHKGVVNFLASMSVCPGVTDADTFFAVTTISFDIAALELYLPLVVGAKVVVVAREVASDGTRLLLELQQSGTTVMQATPATWQMLLASGLSTQKLGMKLLCGGEALNAQLAHQLLQTDSEVWNLYGPTETTIWSSIYQLRNEPQQLQTRSAIASIGRPIANTQIYILDTQLQPVPLGVAGELHIGGASLARGYLNRPELTQEKFIPNPFSADPDSRLYKTGDLARYLPDGNIEYLGRIDNQVKVRGFRIELSEIETVLDQYPHVQASCAIVREDTPGDKRLVAYIMPHQHSTATINELRQFLKAKLPDYMVPNAIVILESLPLTPNGKVDRRALPTPDQTRPDLEETFVSPRTLVEEILAGIWTEVLRVQQVGVHDNFFNIGGHSLTAIQVMSRLNEIFQIELALRQLFETPTIAELAEAIEVTRQTGASATKDNMTIVDLQAQAVLDPTICLGNQVYEPITEPSAVFLTGATGFLGAFLLAEILHQTQADVYCLVRASSTEEGKKRIQKNLESYFLWEASLDSRIIPVIGALSQPLFALSLEQFQELASRIDVIYHNGALVNHAYPYTLLKAANVFGTQEILRLASVAKIKPVHFISTNSVFFSDEYFKVGVVREDDALEHSKGLSGGYAQSKWVAEKLVMIARERGIPCCIYRPGRVGWHSQTGVWNTNDTLYRIIKGCLQLGSVPNMDEMVEISPVDYVSQAIINLSRQKEALGKTFHLINPHSLAWSEIVHCMHSLGYPLQQEFYDDWQAKLIHSTKNSSNNALYPLVALYSQKNSSEQVTNQRTSLHFDCQNTLDGLTGTSISCPKIDDKLLRTFFSYFMHSGVLDAPQSM
ncbi:amino acid adenylation domain-containing protein, partial [Scytonema sp. UIC 10036]|uniref:non-ribosomal peptide synthetase n=1 Tax=Scytonema sp. UIC 10036 TaxID=2304196 RepID=UPI0012DA8ABE